jgi:hypothetical protein
MRAGLPTRAVYSNSAAAVILRYIHGFYPASDCRARQYGSRRNYFFSQGTDGSRWANDARLTTDMSHRWNSKCTKVSCADGGFGRDNNSGLVPLSWRASAIVCVDGCEKQSAAKTSARRCVAISYAVVSPTTTQGLSPTHIRPPEALQCTFVAGQIFVRVVDTVLDRYLCGLSVVPRHATIVAIAIFSLIASRA